MRLSSVSVLKAFVNTELTERLKEEDVSSFRYTMLGCSMAFVVGKMLVFSRGSNKNPFFLLATAVAHPCANSQQMCPSRATPELVSGQPHINLIIS